MIVLSNITRIYKIRIIFATLFAFSMIVSLATLDYKMVLATREKNDTTGQQVDKQSQWVSQGAQCVSSVDVLFVYNNIGIQSQEQRCNFSPAQQ
jgi:hypothetical protein